MTATGWEVLPSIRCFKPFAVATTAQRLAPCLVGKPSQLPILGLWVVSLGRKDLFEGMSEQLDEVVTLEVLKKRIAAFAAERDWEQFHTPKNLSMAISAEAAELMEHFLWLGSEQSCQAVEGPKREKIVEELADIIIYALEFSNIAGVDVAAAIEAKMAANAQKYPIEKAKGNALKYDEF